MEKEWIIIVLVVVFGIALVISLVIKDQKDKKELIKSMNAETDIKNESESESESEKDVE
ncbi:MAG: hypothetical protein ACYC2P_11415 [Paludibacteraceae bacterium]